ncbi:MAG: hypothetical protein NTZ87_03870 [Candidatus Nomurabacteria bacterium]|nr:hypothetical protein [Candidatus Nomurabacteria bacterium]
MIKIVKWFVEKIKKSVENYQTERWWRHHCNLPKEEQLRLERQWTSGLSAEELRQEDEQIAKKKAEMRERERLERLRTDADYQKKKEKKSRCPDCGEPFSDCSCEDDTDDTTFINRQNAMFDEEPEITETSVFLEQMDYPCPHCKKSPDYCLCYLDQE